MAWSPMSETVNYRCAHAVSISFCPPSNSLLLSLQCQQQVIRYPPRTAIIVIEKILRFEIRIMTCTLWRSDRAQAYSWKTNTSYRDIHFRLEVTNLYESRKGNAARVSIQRLRRYTSVIMSRVYISREKQSLTNRRMNARSSQEAGEAWWSLRHSGSIDEFRRERNQTTSVSASENVPVN